MCVSPRVRARDHVADDEQGRTFAGARGKRRAIARATRPRSSRRDGCRGRARRRASSDRARRRSGRRARRPRRRGPYRRPRWSADRRSADQSVAAASSARCAVTSDSRVASLRNVSGRPASAAQPSAAVTPGTTTTATLAARRCSSSSPPRPNMNGSPPLSRTTLRPSRAASTRRRLISSWPMPGWPRRLPTNTCSASRRARSRISGVTSSS